MIRPWVYTAQKGTALRDAIASGSRLATLKGIVDVCNEVIKTKRESLQDFMESFEDLRDEIEIEIEIDDFDEDTVNYYLDELYDLCDAARVFIAL